ncbi:MAG: hypothetical protein JNL18_00305 [Planctomycetaceae bacterium]|nr:hypothetical protein [Planctomycetaceae bacterium]
MPRSRRLDATFRPAARSLRFESLEERRVLSATPELLTDVGSTPDSGDSNPFGFVEVGDLTYFSTRPGTPSPSTTQTWVTDGTTNATRLLSEVLPGNLLVGSVLGNVAGTLYFSASDSGTFGYRLWKWDGFGQAPAPVLSADGQRIAASTPMVNVDDVWYFGGSLQGLQSEIWRTDGTEAGTYRVKSIRSSFSPGAIGQTLFNVNGELLFFADDGVHGNELWKSDGTEAGTVMVKDVNPGAASGVDASLSKTQVAVVGDLLYFTARDQQSDWELWRSDVSESGTYRVKDIRAGVSGSIPSYLTNVGGTLYFTAIDEVLGDSKLWKSDGTEPGTVRVFAASPHVLPSKPFDLTEMNGTLYFGAGGELWRSDGTPAGTRRIVNSAVPHQLMSVPTPFGSSGTLQGYRDNIVNLNGTLYFYGGHYSSSPGLWKIADGTEGATQVLSKDSAGINSNYTFDTIQYLTVAADKLFFAGDSYHHGNEPWVSDGTTGGTTLLKDVSGVSSSSRVVGLMNVGDATFFFANSPSSGFYSRRGLWVTDGSLASTRWVVDLPSDVSDAKAIGQANGVYFFQATASGSSGGLWRSDGTAAGTFKVKSLLAGAKGDQLDFAELDGVLYFGAGGQNNYELWRSDGTEAGTYAVKDLSAGGGLNSGFPLQITRLGAAIYFTVNNGATRGLWRSDGTEAGTTLVREFGLAPAYLLRGGDSLYFAASDGLSGFVLWKSDGTAEGTIPVRTAEPKASIQPPGSYPNFSQLAYVGGQVFFVANDALWKSDGTEAGTFMLKDIRTDGNAFGPGGHPMLVVAGPNVYFVANDGTHGYELWKSDGTVEGTAMVADLNPGTDSGTFSPNGFIQAVAVGERLYFSKPVNSELWVTDGTTVGTMVAADVRPGQYSSNPQTLTNVNGRLYFTADDWTHGRELWALSPDPVAMTTGDYDQNGVTDGADFLKWQRAFGSADVTNDGDNDGTVGNGDLDAWEDNFGAPESASPSSGVAAAVATILADEEAGTDGASTTTTSQGSLGSAAGVSPWAREAIFAAGDFSLLFRTFNPASEDWLAGRRGRGARR